MSKTYTDRVLIHISIAGWVAMGVAILLPPEWLVGRLLPTKGAAYFDMMVKGMWWLKGALMLNGLLAIFFRPLKRWLWDISATTHGTPKILFREPDPALIRRGEWLILTTLILLALVSRLIHAGASFWGDELAVQQMVVSRGLPVIVSYWPPMTHHIGYEIVAWLFLKLPLPIEVAARLPAILFGAASVATTYWLARRAGLPALVVAFLQAISVYSIVYSQMLKGYTANLFYFTLAITGLCLMNEKWPRARGWVLFGAALVALVYTHLHAMFMVTGLALTAGLLLWWPDNFGLRWAMTKRLVLMLGVAACVSLLLYAAVIPQILSMAGAARTLSEERMTFNFFRGWLMQLTFWGRAWPVALSGMVLALVGLVSLARREPRFAVAMGLPVVLVLGVTGVLGVFIYPRYMVFALPLFLMACTEGSIVLFRNRVVAMAVLIVGFTIPSVLALNEYYQIGYQNIRGAVRVVESCARHDDVIVGYGLARPLFRYYNENVRPVSTVSELEDLMKTSEPDVYLIYAWRNAWKARKADFDWIHKHFDVVQRFDGILMDSSTRDGEVVVLKSRNVSAGYFKAEKL